MASWDEAGCTIRFCRLFTADKETYTSIAARMMLGHGGETDMVYCVVSVETLGSSTWTDGKNDRVVDLWARDRDLSFVADLIYVS